MQSDKRFYTPMLSYAERELLKKKLPYLTKKMTMEMWEAAR